MNSPSDTIELDAGNQVSGHDRSSGAGQTRDLQTSIEERCFIPSLLGEN